jgi:hypothetical protein
MAGSSFRSSLLIAALLAAAGTAGYDIYLQKFAPAPSPTVVHDPPSAEAIAKAIEPMQRELDAAKLRLAAITGDRDNLKQQLDALNKPAPAPAGEKAKAAALMQKQLDAATRQRDAALSEAAALKRRTQQSEAQPAAAPAPQPPPAGGGKVYTQRSVAELRELYAGGEAAPGSTPMANETGKWIETTNMRVVGIAGGSVLLLKKDNSNIQCAFADSAKAKLATLRVGDAVKVTGKINQDQNGQLVNLEDCELRE